MILPRITRITAMLLLLAGLASAQQRIIPPANLFRDPEFVKSFVGSYGILSDVEPRVSAAEQELLVNVSELFEQSRFAEAERAIVQFIDETENPTDREIQPAEISPAMIFVLGNLYFQSNRPADARRAFLEAIRRFPRFRRAHTNLAYLHISRNELTEALPMLQKAIELGENSARAYGLLGFCHLNARNALAAENAYRQGYLLDPSARDWKIGLAQALMIQEKYPEAISLFGSLIEENPNDREIWLQQTNAYLALDRKEDAIVNLETLRLKGLARESELTLLGNLHLATEQPQLALLSYLAAVEDTKDLDVPRALKTAMILTDYGFPEKSDSMIAAIREKAGESLDTESKTLLLLAEVRSSASAGIDERVSELLASLTELNPADHRVLLEIARHSDRLSREESDEDQRAALVVEARTHYQLAARDEKSESAYPANLSLGQLLVREKRHVEALPFLQAALEIKPSDSLTQYVSRVRRAADRQTDRED